MPRIDRQDQPGCLHHVLSRGVARRTLYEDPCDYQAFMTLLAGEVRRDSLRVHAFALMPNHFHLLVTSASGCLSIAMQRLLNRYSRFFNLRLDRAGPLFQDRFHSKPVEGEDYLANVVRYIDRNPCAAGLATAPGNYPFGSAAVYLGKAQAPWLARALVEDLACGLVGADRFDTEVYGAAFGLLDPDFGAELAEQRLLHPKAKADSLSIFTSGSPAATRRWFRERAQVADGCWAPHPAASTNAILHAVRVGLQRHGTWRMRARGLRIDLWEVIATALLRDLGGRAFMQVGSILGFSRACAHSRYLVHRDLCEDDTVYEERLAATATLAVRICRKRRVPSCGLRTKARSKPHLIGSGPDGSGKRCQKTGRSHPA